MSEEVEEKRKKLLDAVIDYPVPIDADRESDAFLDSVIIAILGKYSELDNIEGRISSLVNDYLDDEGLL